MHTTFTFSCFLFFDLMGKSYVTQFFECEGDNAIHHCKASVSYVHEKKLDQEAYTTLKKIIYIYENKFCTNNAASQFFLHGRNHLVAELI